MSGHTLLRLKVRDPHGREREVSFTQDAVTIGRSGECDLTLESGFISRLHARLLHAALGWQIADEGSKNGVFVNGQRVSGRAPIAKGDALRIGDFGVTVAETEPVDAEEDEHTVIAQRSAAAGPSYASSLPEPEPEDEPTVRVISPALQPLAVTGEAAGEAVANQQDAAVDREPVAVSASETEVTPVEGSAATGTAEPFENVQPSAPDTDLPADLNIRERTLLEALVAAGPEGAAPAGLVEAVWGSGGADMEMLERLLVRAQQKLGARQIERMSGGSLRLN